MFWGFGLVFFLFDFVEGVLGAGDVDELSDLLVAALAAGAGAAVPGDLLDSLEVVFTNGTADGGFVDTKAVADQFVLIGEFAGWGLWIIGHRVGSGLLRFSSI